MNSIWIQRFCKVMLYHLVNDSHVLETLVPSKTAWPSRWKHYNPLQCCEPLAQHCVKSQNLNPYKQCCEKLKNFRLLLNLIWWFSYFSSNAYFVKYFWICTKQWRTSHYEIKMSVQQNLLIRWTTCIWTSRPMSHRQLHHLAFKSQVTQPLSAFTLYHDQLFVTVITIHVA